MGLFDALKRGGNFSPASARAEDDVAHADELISRGHALEDTGRIGAALEHYQAAAAIAPAHARAHLNIGNARMAQGDALAALHDYERALQLRSGYAPAHFNMGNARAQLGGLAQAVDCYRQAVQSDPQFVDAWVALGNAQDELGMHDGALESYAQALRLRPDHAPVLVNRAEVQGRMGLLSEALESCHRALEIVPTLAQAHGCMGTLLQKQGEWQKALASFRRAAECGSDGALVQAYHCANQLCDWSRRDETERELTRLVASSTPNMAPFPLLNLAPATGGGPALQREAARQFAESTLGAMLGTPPLVHTRARGTRLRIGYVSADLHEHATMHLLRGVLASHDRSQFEITAFSHGAVHDEMTRYVRDTCESFHDIAKLSDADAAALIARHGIDILVDLKGFTRDARPGIGACRPAPVVVSWLGYPGTLGHPRLADWIIGDPVVTPLEHAADFSEGLALMPHCYQPNDRQRTIGRRTTRSDVGLPEDAFVFCSFNQPYKFGPETFDVWCRVLRDTPGSVLWLIPASQAMADNLRREAATRGVDGARLVFAPSLPLADHLARLSLADLALDTFPYNSHTTGSDALWAGVPLVTRMGDTFASRVAASLLHAVGLPELVTRDWEGFATLATKLTADRERLAMLGRTLAANRTTHPLFDTAGFTRDLERLFARMWERHEQGRRDPIVLTAGG